MATYTAGRSLRTTFLAFLVIGSFATGCKKSEGVNAVDPRDQYVGVYDGNYTSTTYINNTLPTGDPEAGKVQITISKAQAANQVYMELLFNSTTKQTMTAELSDSTYTIIDKKSEPLIFGGKTYTADYSAQGQFLAKEKAITLNTKTETLTQGVTLTKRGDITGVKK